MQTSPACPTWYVELLGTFNARRSETDSIERFPTRQTTVLLAYLACHDSRKHAREELIDLLWPEAELEAGRLRLRVALNALRHRLEPPSVPPYSILFADRHWVHLQPGAVTTDVAAFERLLASSAPEDNAAAIARLTQAVALYRGELLPGYYDDWIQRARVRLAERVLNAFQALALAWEAQGNGEQASEYARRVLATDPFHEDAYLLLMRVYARSGNAPAALQQYEELEVVLKTISASPSPRASELVELIRIGKYTVPPVDTAAPVKISDLAPLGAPVAVLPAAQMGLAHRSRLPTSLTRFYGRSAEIAHLAALLSDPGVRLVTLTGIGGTGKTRLALEVARRILPAFDRVCFVSLSDVCEAGRLPDTLAQALALTLQPEIAPLEQLLQFLESHSALFLLDNFEQLLPEGADFVHDLLKRLPMLTLLTTSRLPLSLSCEQEFAVFPLAGPTVLPLSPVEALQFPDVALFVDRAQAVKPVFQITERNAAAIIALCRRLDGLPLAIELAASWAGTLTPAQMLPRLNRRLDLLVTGRRDVPARHQTLRAAIQWSYDRLDLGLQRFFTRLSVFSGGWTLEAAESVCQEPDAVHYLQLLRERSLIIAEEVHVQTGEAGNEGEDRFRFRMLETLWEFAREKLEATLTEEENQTLRLKHARWYLARLQRQDFAVSEVENFRAAHNWVQAQPDQTHLYFQLVLKLSLFWRTKGWWCEGLSCLEAALTREESAYPDLYAQIMCSTASLCRMLKDYPASMRYYQQALVLLKEAGNLRGLTDALNGMGCTALDQQQHEEAKRYLHQSLLLAVQIHDDPMAASIHGNLGYVAMHQKDWQTAQEHLQQCLAIHHAQNASLAWPLQNLGELAYAQEQWTEARDFFTASLEKYRQIDETYRIAEVLEQLSEVLRRCGDPEAAARCFEESQILSRHLRGSST